VPGADTPLPLSYDALFFSGEEMNFRKFGMFLSCAALLVLSYAAYGYYELSWGWRWEEVNAIGAGIKGDVDTLLAYKEKARDMQANVKLASIVGGLTLTVGLGAFFATADKRN
jgi:hypothetical protein